MENLLKDLCYPGDIPDENPLGVHVIGRPCQVLLQVR